MVLVGLDKMPEEQCVIDTDRARKHITNNLRVIPNAWHFSSHCEFSVYGGMVEFCGSVTHTLIGR